MNPAHRRRFARLLPAAALLGALGGCALWTEEPTEPELPYAPPTIEPVAAPGLDPIAPTVVHSGSRSDKRIALTFDACATRHPSQYDERVARTLIDMQVPATIFLSGKWMEEHPEQTRFLAAQPLFELGNHSFLHPHLTKVPDARLRLELKWTQDVLYTLTGRQGTLFRAPYGEIDARVVRLAAEAGLTTVQYDLPSGDPDKRVSKKKLVEYVAGTARSGSIVVMHINRRGWHTAEALPEIIKRLRARGYRFVTVSELLDRPDEPAPPSEQVRARPIERDILTR